MENVREVKIAVIGGGPAGMSAALAAYENGVAAKDILIIEREESLGGILKQCIHSGFGLHRFKEELTGPEYAHRYVEMIKEAKIPYLCNAMVLELNGGDGKDKKTIKATSSVDGIVTIKADSVILAMGCRERPRGALTIAGERPAGIYTAGTAQKYVNIMGYMPGKKVVILGSGDIGLIMARRMTLEGAQVLQICEIAPKISGLARNVQQCVSDFGIPLRLSCTVVKVHGRERVEGVTIADVDENFNPKPGTERYLECDTLLLSCGLIPENDLSRAAGIDIDPRTNGAVCSEEDDQTSIPGIFACGNVRKVFDLVDNVSKDAVVAGTAAAEYVRGK